MISSKFSLAGAVDATALHLTMNRTRADRAPIDPITISIADACKATGLGRNSIYKLINEKVLTTVRIGRRQLVHVQSIKKAFGGSAI